MADALFCRGIRGRESFRRGRMTENIGPAAGYDPAQLARLGQLLGTATPADTLRSAVEFALQFAELARSTRLPISGGDPAQLDLLVPGATCRGGGDGIAHA
jgi:hypothetical protein